MNCGHGTKNRTRVCNNPAPKYGGLDCAGNASEVIGCGAKQCPGTEYFHYGLDFSAIWPPASASCLRIA